MGIEWHLMKCQCWLAEKVVAPQTLLPPQYLPQVSATCRSVPPPAHCSVFMWIHHTSYPPFSPIVTPLESSAFFLSTLFHLLCLFPLFLFLFPPFSISVSLHLLMHVTYPFLLVLDLGFIPPGFPLKSKNDDSSVKNEYWQRVQGENRAFTSQNTVPVWQ